MNQKEYFKRNRLIQSIRFSNRSGSHCNCFRYHKNNSDEHENTKFEIFKKLINQNYDVWTETIFIDGYRADILAIKDGKGYIVEIETKHSDERMLDKQKNYPQEFELIEINTKDFNIATFEI